MSRAHYYIANSAAAIDSWAPDTVRAWSDHYLIQSSSGGKWQCDGCETDLARAKAKARYVEHQLPTRSVRIVKPNEH